MNPLALFFTQLVTDSNLVDLGHPCAGPTWRNGRASDDGTSKMLDIFFISASLVPSLSRHRVWSAPFVVSYYYPIYH